MNTDPDAFARRAIDACGLVLKSQDSVGALPSQLYHFTDAEGLTGIASSKALWATLSTSLNDASEVKLGVAWAKAIAQARAAEEPTEYFSALAECLENPTGSHFGMSYEVTSFVASFCHRSDSALHWLHYGRSGAGVALRFSPLVSLAVDRDLVRVDYDSGSHQGRVSALIEVGRKLAAGAAEDWAMEAAAHIVSIHTPALSVRLKHPSFAGEEEFRLVGMELANNGVSLTDASSIFLRDRRTGAVPTDVLGFANDLSVLQEVILGYSSTLDEHEVQATLLEAGFDVPVTRSAVPVRPTV